MLEEMDPGHLVEWRRFFELEPFGAATEDFRSGIMASLLYNANRGKGKRALEPADFFPTLKEIKKHREQTPDEMRNIMLAWVLASGGTIQ